jgi:hypothetical protein
MHQYQPVIKSKAKATRIGQAKPVKDNAPERRFIKSFTLYHVKAFE